jgi:phosphatidylglycerol lysyltransferase
LSYAALVNYDRLALEYLCETQPLAKVMAISFTAFAIGHNVGIAALSGGSIRYRAYARLGISALRIAKIIGFCSVTFALGASLLLGLALLFEPASMLALLGLPAVLLKCAAVVLLVLPIAYMGGSRIGGNVLRLRGWRMAWPSPSICIQQCVFACLELLFAAGVLYVMLPEALGLSFANLLGAYLIAVGLGVVSNVPGGLGVIEGMLLLLLPDVSKATLLSAIVAYRIIYYLIPLSVALMLLAAQEIAVHRRRA